jgi:hypothetical protein
MHEYTQHGGHRIITDTDNTLMVLSPVSAEGRAAAVANARLIAAAPEMLAALRESVEAYEQHRDDQPTGHLWPDPNYIFHARKVIAKAGG